MATLKEELTAIKPGEKFTLVDTDETKQNGTFTRSEDGTVVNLVSDDGFDLGDLDWEFYVEGFALLASEFRVERV